MYDRELSFKGSSSPVTNSPELDLGFSDTEILDLIDQKLAEYKAFYTSKKIKERTEKMMRYWKGDQSVDRNTKTEGRVEYINNVIHRDLATRVQNATSRMPDLVAMSPEQEDDLSVREQVRSVEQWLNIRLDSDVLKRLAKAALIDNHLQLRGIWMYRYDHFRKDAVIERLRPEDVILDSTARIPEDGFTCDNMEFIGVWIEDSTARILAQFPDKKQELLDEIDRVEVAGKEKAKPSKIRYLQSWATMHDEEGIAHELLIHSYNNIILHKGPSPYWVEEDVNAQFQLEPEQAPIDPLSLPPELQQLGITQLPEPTTPKRKNFFEFARKPFTLFSGENTGEGPLDDTNVVEISLSMQDIVNKRGNQITLINDWAVPKIVTGAKYMTEEKAENISRDPTEIIHLSNEAENISQALVAISGTPASPALYKDLQDAVAAIDSHFSTNPVTRGETVTQESGISKQISREGDLSASDDIAQTMLQRSIEEAANWLLQFVKIFYDEPRSASSPGPDKSLTKVSISSNLIPDGLQVIVRASAVDKSTKRNVAMNLASMKAIDPYSLFEDLDYPNPKEMTKRLVDFLAGPPEAYVRYMQDVGIKDVTQPANMLSEGGAQSSGQGMPQGVPPEQSAPPSEPPLPPSGNLPVAPPGPPIPLQ